MMLSVISVAVDTRLGGADKTAYVFFSRNHVLPCFFNHTLAMLWRNKEMEGTMSKGLIRDI